MTYTAIVCKIQTRPHPNADKLLLGTAKGYQVVVGLDTVDDQLGVFFASDGQLSPEMCEANDLIGYTDEETGERRGGFFGKNRRVRAQKFRGEKSDGYWTPLSALAFTGVDLSKLRDGMEFDELNGIPICNKYFTPATLKAQSAGGQIARSNNNFAKHVETTQFKRDVDRIPHKSVLYITEKLHGTSGRIGNVIEETNLKTPLWKRPFAKFTKKHKTKSEYKVLLGTRNVILKDHNSVGFYGSEEFRWNSVSKLVDNLHKGEVIYYELVGYTTTGTPIMSAQATDELSDIKKQFGGSMLYSYGQPPATTGLYVYRITRVNDDGDAVELTWPQVRKRCNELGVKYVPQLYGPIVASLDKTHLRSLVDDFLEGTSTLDDSHIREGVVVRVESTDGTTSFLKAKSFTFGVLEGYLKNSDDYVDLEEVS